MKILLVFGGPSREHEVSINTAKEVFSNINKKKYDVELLYIDKKSRARFVKGFEKLSGGTGGVATGSFISVLPILKKYNLAFLCMHGEFGEDGTIQSLFEHVGVKYTGSDSYASRLAMDKYRSVLLVGSQVAVDIAPAKLIYSRDGLKAVTKFPYVLKPNRAGSSVGVYIIKKPGDLKAVNEDFSEGFLVQKFIPGVEITCGCLQKADGSFVMLPPVEIRPKKGSFFDYESKYADGGSDELVPPVSFSKSFCDKVSKLACEIHVLLGCKTYSRSDFIVNNGRLFYLETNTLPGMTANSLLPKEARGINMSYSELLDFIIANS